MKTSNVPEVPLVTIDTKGRVFVQKASTKIRDFVGIAYDTVCLAWVWIDMIRGIFQFLVSNTIENAFCELEYLESKYR